MSQYAVLSEAWFSMVEEENMRAGELPLSPDLAKLCVDIDAGDVAFHLKNGKLHQGLVGAGTVVHTDSQTLQKILHDKSVESALGAFMQGKVRIDGDMGALMTLQTKPADEVKALYYAIYARTKF